MENLCKRRPKMIEKNRLRKIHNQDLPLHILEQNYIQALFLMEFYTSYEDLIFKGGTYLKHAHGLDRFSETLDFTALNSNKNENKNKIYDKIILELTETTEELRNYGIPSTLQKIQRKPPYSFTSQIVYEGPLYQGTEKSKGRVDIEISIRNDRVLEPEWIRLFFQYPECRAFACLGMKKEEALAEKLRALSTRDRPRDLYDIWFLLNQNTKIKKDIFEKKMHAIGKNPVVKITTTEQTWKEDLKVLLRHPPKYNKVLQKVKNKLKENNIETNIKK